MKKFVTTLILSILSAVCIFAFTACGESDEEQTTEVKTTVTENEWKAALSYFMVDSNEYDMPVSNPDYPRINYSCLENIKITVDNETVLQDIVSGIDFDKTAVVMQTTEEGKAVNSYVWKDGEDYYDKGYGWRVDEEAGVRVWFDNKKKTSEEEVLSGFDVGVMYYAGGEHISALALCDNFSKFTYSEEKQEYTASFNYENYKGTCDLVITFENAKLKCMKINIDSEYGLYNNVYTYTYGTTVTVPEYYINLPLGETVMPN